MVQAPGSGFRARIFRLIIVGSSFSRFTNASSGANFFVKVASGWFCSLGVISFFWNFGRISMSRSAERMDNFSRSSSVVARSIDSFNSFWARMGP